MKNKEVYLDAAANTPIDKQVLAAMKPFLRNNYMGNAFATHNYGIKANIALENARSTIAKCLKCKPNEVYFTSGATESNNTVIKGLALNAISNGEKMNIVCGATEHSSVIKACQSLEKLGITVTYVHPNKRGRISALSIKKAIQPDTKLICVMAVNNEIGVVNEADKAAAYAKKHKILSLIDCTQALSYGGKEIELISKYPHGDYFSFSAHKIYGPTGVGCLIAREDVPLYPLISGGSQENGKRSGTSNIAGIVGMAKAIELIHDISYENYYKYLYNYFIDKLLFSGFGRLNVTPDHKNIISVNLSRSFDYPQIMSTLATLDIAVSAGSACDSTHDDITGKFNPSHVLLELGLSERDIRNTIRISFYKDTTKKDIDSLFNALEVLLND